MRFALATILVVTAAPAFSESEMEVSCSYQADVMKAVQQARLDNVSEEDVEKTILATDPAWPENFNGAIKPLASFVYQQEMNVVKKHDLSEPYRQNCMNRWEETNKLLNK